MLQKSLLTLFAALSLAGALTAQAAPTPKIVISALPFTITAPGTYVLNSNLTYNPGGPAPVGGINILSQQITTGAVVIDFQGHSITGAGFSITGSAGIGVVVGGPGNPLPNSTPVTIRNGTIANFYVGIEDYQTSGITVNKMTFNQNYYGIELNTVGNASINSCVFNGFTPPISGQTAVTGINEFLSPGGNSYSNNVFHDVYTRFTSNGLDTGDTRNITLDRLSFAPPVSP